MRPRSSQPKQGFEGATMQIAGNYVAGEWIESTQAAEDVNPSNTADIVGLYARADETATIRAIDAAKQAFTAWSRGSIQQRHDLLKRVGDEILARKDELGRLLAREEGKTLAEGIGETVRAGQIFLFFAAECVRLAGERISSVRPNIDIEVTREPLGVVGLITPWNFPIAIPAWKIAPALAYGNCVVFKPADLVPGTAHALSEIIAKAGVPPGVFNLVMGRGSVVGETLVEARAAAGNVPGRRTTLGLTWPLTVPAGDWARTLRTTWVEPGYLEPDASWCVPKFPIPTARSNPRCLPASRSPSAKAAPHPRSRPTP